MYSTSTCLGDSNIHRNDRIHLAREEEGAIVATDTIALQHLWRTSKIVAS